MFEEPLFGEGPSAVEMFQTKEGLMSCFVKGDTITVYKQNKKIQEIKITESTEQIELPA